MIRYVRFLLVAICAVSCTLTEIEIPEKEESQSGEVRVIFCAQTSPMTRSSVSPDEVGIKDLNVYAFRDGILADEAYVSGKDAADLFLAKGYEYNIYAVANMGQMSASADEEEFLSAFSYSIDGLSDISDVMPMFCICDGLYVAGGSPTIRLDMERLVSKLSLAIDKSSLLEGLQVRSVRLCQSSSVVRPFKWYGKGGSRAENPSEVIDGDFATAYDLKRLNDGEEILFYALENCQGVLLPDNKDSALKVPGNLVGKDELCTYLEVCCAFGNEGLLDGVVDYRIYLGLDATSSFDLPGNSCINVTLNLTESGLDEVSWKVDADVSVRDGYARGRVAEGMHPLNNLYVGEKLLYEVTLADDLFEYIGGNAQGCTLAFMSEGEKTDEIIVESLVDDGSVMYAELFCREPVVCELYLYGPTGECLGLLDKNINVKVPSMLFSEYDRWMDSDPVEPLTYAPDCQINGRGAEFYLYMVDDGGYNLNGPRSYGYDASLFDFQHGGAVSGSSDVCSVWTEYNPLHDGGRGSAAARVLVFCENYADDHALNLLMADIYHGVKEMRVAVEEMNFGITRSVSVGLDILQICLALVDNGWAGYHDCQLSVTVNNPSNLPLEVNAWQLVSTNTKAGASDDAYVESNLTISRIEYMTGAFYNGDPPLYGSSASFTSEGNNYGSAAIVDGNLLVYPLKGISTADIIKAIRYDKLGNNQMMHMLDVTVNSRKIRDGDVVLQDNVSDGSATYDHIYYNADAWNYRGAALFSGGELMSCSGRWAYDYPNVSAQSLSRMYNRHLIGMPVCVSMDYDLGYDAVAISTQVGKGSQYGLTVSISYEGVVNGYVQTFPKGTWYSAQDNYCSVDIGYEVDNIPLKANTPEIWADEAKINAAVAKIYDFSYKDSPNRLGSDSYMHRAHPIDLNLDVCFCVEGTQKAELYPVSVDWNFESIPFYHAQDDKDYNCVLNADYKGFEMVVVKHK